MVCHLKSFCTDTDCSVDEILLQTVSHDDIIVVLTEVGLKRDDIITQSFSYYKSICFAHFNFLLKRNVNQCKRSLCQVPSLFSSHPDIDHSLEPEQVRKFPHRRGTSKNSVKKSTCLHIKDILLLQKCSGIILPVGTRKFVYCITK